MIGDRENKLHRKFMLFSVLLILGLSFGVYANSLHNEFGIWDGRGFKASVAQQPLSVVYLKNLFTLHRGSTYQPVRMLSLAIDYHFWELNPVGYHIHNIILHGLAAVFLFLALTHVLPQIGGRGQVSGAEGQGAGVRCQMSGAEGQGAGSNEQRATSNGKTGKRGNKGYLSFIIGRLKSAIRNPKSEISGSQYNFIALATVLLFVVHPVNTESVAWIYGRKYTLLGFFSFFSFYLFVRSSKNNQYHPWYSLGSILSCIMAALSSPFGVVVPGLLFLFDYCRDASNNPIRVLKRRFIYYIPYIVFLFLMVPMFWFALVAGAGMPGGADKEHFMGKPIYTFLTMIRVFFDYARNLVLPLWLNVRYADWVSKSFLEFKVLISSSCIILTTALIFIRTLQGKKLLLFCFGWFIISWSPVSNIIPISTKMADRYIYLAAVGVFLWAAVVLNRFFPFEFEKLFKKKKPAKTILSCFILICLISWFSYLSIVRNRVWANDATLWEDSVKKEPGNALANYNYGFVLKEQGKYEAAIPYFYESMRINPEYVPTYINIGNILFKQGKYQDAIKLNRFALRIDPDSADLHNNMGCALSRDGRVNEAVDHFSEALRINPGDADVHNNWGSVLARDGRIDEAVDHFLEALRIQSNHVDVLNNLGNALKVQGRIDEAVDHYLKALRIKPDCADAHGNIGDALIVQGRIDEAIGHYLEALRINPDYADAHSNLGNALMAQGRIDEAIGHYLEALRINPDYADVHSNLGNALMAQGRIDEAIGYYLEALRVKPDYADAHNNLGNALAMEGRMDEAIEHYLETLRINPDYANVHNNIGNALIAQGRTDEAIGHYLDALHIMPDNADIHNNLGNALIHKGNIDGAIEHFQKALSIMPDNTRARNSLVKLKEHIGYQ